MKEIKVLINDYIPAIITEPKEIKKAVIMLHGTGSDKNEVFNSYEICSKVFCESYDILSVRFDFQGCGESRISYRNYNLNTAIDDVLKVYEYIKINYDVKDISILGWSQGSSVAMTCVGKYPTLFSSLITFATAMKLYPSSTFTEKMYKEAKEKGYCKLEFGFRDSLDLDISWFNSFINLDILNLIKNYNGKILAIHGDSDDVVDMKDSVDLINNSNNKKSELFIVENANHIFNVIEEKNKETFYKIIEKSGKFING